MNTRLLRQLIAIELVVVVTGVALLLPRNSELILGLYLAAVIVSAIVAAWRGGLAATVGGIAALLVAFGSVVSVAQVIVFAAAGIVISIGLSLARRPAPRPITSVFAPPAETKDEDVERIAAEKRGREEAQRIAAEARAREETERKAKAEAARVASEKQAREEAERKAKAEGERVAAEKRAREEAERKAKAEADARAERERVEAETRAREETQRKAKAEAERVAAEKRAREETERKAKAEADARAARERVEAERLAAEKRAREEVERKAKAEADAKAERERLNAERIATEKRAREDAERIAREKRLQELERERGAREQAERAASERSAAETKKKEEPKPSLLGRLFRPVTVNLARGNAAPTPPQPKPPGRKPRILLLERRRAIADVVVPAIRQRGADVMVVERWVDAVDEIFRFRPDVFFLDSEFPDFDEVYKSTLERAPNLPVIITAKENATLPSVRNAGFMRRPYGAVQMAAIAQEAMEHRAELLARQATPVVTGAEQYLVSCFNCGVAFDAIESDWCSCLTKERTLVCTNCLTCCCNASPEFNDKLWLEAPASVHERKFAERSREAQTIGPNPAPVAVRHPMVMLVESDGAIQSTVQRVCTNLGYGFIAAANGAEGLQLARTYKPNLVLADGFTPKLDGREMCRLLKEEIDAKTVVMTGIYTDTKYKPHALERFRLDDYLVKPVSITDLINLLQRFLEGVTELPQQADPHELHRQFVADDRPYDAGCFNCGKRFDATHAEWCTAHGNDKSVICPHCSHCFCAAPAPYRERFWSDAPSSLFERKMIGASRAVTSEANPPPEQARHPLLLLVSADEDIRLLVRTVASTLGHGIAVADNAHDGITMARAYKPDVVLFDAIDGRDLAPLLDEARLVAMTGLGAAVTNYIGVKEWIPKPIEVSDLLALLRPQRL